MAIEGPLRELALSDVFQLLDLSRKTGTLTITNEGRSRPAVVRFDRGAVVSAELPGTSERLGHLLLRAARRAEPNRRAVGVDGLRDLSEAFERRADAVANGDRVADPLHAPVLVEGHQEASLLLVGERLDEELPSRRELIRRLRERARTGGERGRQNRARESKFQPSHERETIRHKSGSRFDWSRE